MIHTLMLEAEQSMRRTLRSYSLADITNGMTSTMPPRFMQNMEGWFRDRLSRRIGRGEEPEPAPTPQTSFVHSDTLKRRNG